MFKDLFPMAAKGAFSLLLSADEANGLMTVVVVPKTTDNGKEVPALAVPLKLTATPEELDAGFVQALASYATARTSLDEQVAATNEVLEAAKAASVKKGADALSKAGAKAAPKGAHKPMTASSEPDESDDDGDASGGGEDAQAAPSGESNTPAPAGGATVPDLFGA